MKPPFCASIRAWISAASALALLVAAGARSVSSFLAVLRVLGHLVDHDVGGIAGETQQLRLLGAQLGDGGDDVAQVVGSGRVAARFRGGHDAQAQVAILQGGEDRLLGGVGQHDHPFAVELARLGGVGGDRDLGVAEAVQVGLVVDDDRVGVGGGDELGLILRLQAGDLAVDLGQRGLVGGRELRAGVHEAVIVAIQQEFLVAGQAQGAARFIEHLHAGEELGVEVDGVAERLQARRLLLVELVERVVGVRAGQVAEQGGDARQQLPGVLEGGDGVVEGRRGGVDRDLVGVGLLLRHAGLDGRLIVLVLDLIERGGLERQGRDAGERVAGGQARPASASAASTQAGVINRSAASDAAVRVVWSIRVSSSPKGVGRSRRHDRRRIYCGRLLALAQALVQRATSQGSPHKERSISTECVRGSIVVGCRVFRLMDPVAVLTRKATDGASRRTDEAALQWVTRRRVAEFSIARPDLQAVSQAQRQALQRPGQVEPSGPQRPVADPLREQPLLAPGRGEAGVQRAPVGPPGGVEVVEHQGVAPESAVDADAPGESRSPRPRDRPR